MITLQPSKMVVSLRGHLSRLAPALILLSATCAGGAETRGGETPVEATPTVSSLEAASTLSHAGEGVQADTAAPVTTELRFSFNGAPWRDVIEWVAEEAGLALQFGELPPGSFTYNDQGSFSPEAAINRVNLFLIPEGFALVRSGNLLSVVNLNDPRSLSQLDAIAEMITPAELDSRSDQDVVKCLFRLQKFDAEEAVEELSSLQLMTDPSVLEKTNQLLITDTVAKLRSVQKILDSFQPAAMTNGTVVKSFQLDHVSAEDVLEVARPHLGLATGEMIGIDVSLSSDVLGKHLFVTGVEDKVKVIEGLVEAIDQPDPDAEQMQADSILKSYVVEGGNVEMVYDVLQTLLSGKSVRLSIDETAGSIVALADAKTQREIEMTVEELKASEADFEVIPLKNIDAYYAINLLEQMLDLSPSGFYDDDDDSAENLPKIDADAGNRRLFVRAKRPQIEQIKKIISDLEASESPAFGSNVRVLPLTTSQAERVLQTASRFWRGENPISRIPSDVEESMPTERVPAQSEPTPSRAQQFERSSDDSPFRQSPSKSQPHAESFTKVVKPRFSADQVDRAVSLDKEPIQFQVTPRGLLLQSSDTEALDRFEELVRSISGPNEMTTTKPIIFYLQHIKADDALRMLTKLIDGGESAKESDAGTLVNGYLSAQSSFVTGGYLSTAEGTLTLTSGSMTVVADTRLNRLIAQGSTTDISTVEDYLRIIDKQDGITDVLTHGQSRVIELDNIRASEAADVIRQSFASRVASEEGAGGGQSDGRRSSDPRSRDRDDDRDRRREPSSRGSQTKDLAPTMTVAVHEGSNSLVVTAPDSLFEEVQSLISLIDTRGEQSIEVVVPSNVLAVEAALEGMLIETSRSSSSSRRSRSER
ncbi:secretin N-terminal domain-containing protein [Allorhodopirellula solitaria]|uniref:Bacterial type II/III secretion system short domain protein n=1 Tax=Allorhodopirellula solitaria TaxID=2527987 RepID=A0A5C5XSI9_9BACT|nr:secretin N-terminal domain-containing protein [Allorhodopirellula solitaria]TWT65343.1 Bacterial type II/III secretion system short domain protein [Allorhodopirellula solitaria]